MEKKFFPADGYKHFISLGYFCSVASELEKIGLREASSPFDWCISDFEGVIKAIKEHFADFLNAEYLLQSKEHHKQYMNEIYHIQFFHDFDQYKSLEIQLPRVQEKYKRRIQRFYKDISEPTLFIRYISGEIKDKNGISEELKWIEKHYDDIIALLKFHNADNDILFIANKDITSDVLWIYNVEEDENDYVAREPLDKNEELKALLDGFDYSKREYNLSKYEEKKKKESNRFRKQCDRVKAFIKGKLVPEYIHCRQY